jgi:hypothetical protein
VLMPVQCMSGLVTPPAKVQVSNLVLTPRHELDTAGRVYRRTNLYRLGGVEKRSDRIVTDQPPRVISR